MYAHKRTVFTWLAKRLFEPLNDLARVRALANLWDFTRGCHHCGHATWQMGPCCCFCGGDKDTPHMARAVNGARPCCRVCQSAPLPSLPQRSVTLQASRKVGEINTYTGVHKAAVNDHRMPAQVFLESSLPQFSGKLPVYQEQDTPVPGSVRIWQYEMDDDDTQPREAM